MFSSVRIRLTLWYTLSMTIVLVALAAGIYFVLGQNVIRRADAVFAMYRSWSTMRTVICWALLKAIASPKNSRVRVAKCSPHPCARLPLLPKHSVRST